MDLRLNLPRSIGIERLETLKTGARDADFMRYAEGSVSAAPSAVLLSGGPLRAQDENRYSIAVGDPFLIFRSKGNACVIETKGQVFHLSRNPLAVLEDLCTWIEPTFGLLVPPFSGGAVGYLAYDLKNTIERLPATARDDLDLPDLFLFWPKRILIHDRKEETLRLLVLSPEGEAADSGGNRGVPGNTPPSDAALDAGPLTSNFTREDYIAAVKKVRWYIRRGDVYQVNLSQRFRFTLKGAAFNLWRRLFAANPAPFYAYVNAGSHEILSTSMERFLLRLGSRIETRPIKGTRKRGKTPEEDSALAYELLQSRKDDAELSMIVDLLRNDLGRVCSPRTIRVEEHKRLETYQNVHHLVSIITGELRPDTTHSDILQATFPGGSITGCPKIRSMEIIDELEPTARHVYTGGIGYLGWHQNMDCNIAIRTVVVKDGECYFSVGGGIVFDSDEEEEYQETLHKGRTLFDLIAKLGRT